MPEIDELVLCIHLRSIDGGTLRTIAIYPLTALPLQGLTLGEPATMPVVPIPFVGPFKILVNLEHRPCRSR